MTVVVMLIDGENERSMILQHLPHRGDELAIAEKIYTVVGVRHRYATDAFKMQRFLGINLYVEEI